MSRSLMRFLLIMFVFLIILVAILYSPHRDDAQKKAECEAAGGTFIYTKQPLSICVQEIKPKEKK